MRRRTFDLLASIIGLGLAALLVVAGSLLTWAHNYVHDQVHSQLAAQKIYFPPKGSPATAGPEFKQMRQYAGQLMTTGDQAEVYADHFIAIHLSEIAGGKTYAELSSQFQAMTDAQKASPKGQALNGQVQTMFRGETLRGLLLDAYAFGKMGTIAGIAAIAAFVGAALMLVLGVLGLWHSRRVPDTEEFLAEHKHPAPALA